MWEELLQKFNAENGPRYYELKAAITNCKKRDTSEVTYFAKLKKIMG